LLVRPVRRATRASLAKRGPLEIRAQLAKKERPAQLAQWALRVQRVRLDQLDLRGWTETRAQRASRVLRALTENRAKRETLGQLALRESMDLLDSLETRAVLGRLAHKAPWVLQVKQGP